MTKAQFKGWRLNANGVKDPDGPFEIQVYEHRTLGLGGVVWHARLVPTGQRIAGSWGSEKKAQEAISGMFREKEKDWA